MLKWPKATASGTGIAVARDGRIFVNYPRWSETVPFSVGELKPGGSVTPYPDATLNTWEPGMDPAYRFVCVQSVVVDRDGSLWILDPANPRFQGVVTGGPKLAKVDLAKLKEWVENADADEMEEAECDDFELLTTDDEDPGKTVVEEPARCRGRHR